MTHVGTIVKSSCGQYFVIGECLCNECDEYSRVVGARIDIAENGTFLLNATGILALQTDDLQFVKCPRDKTLTKRINRYKNNKELQKKFFSKLATLKMVIRIKGPNSNLTHYLIQTDICREELYFDMVPLIEGLIGEAWKNKAVLI